MIDPILAEDVRRLEKKLSNVRDAFEIEIRALNRRVSTLEDPNNQQNEAISDHKSRLDGHDVDIDGLHSRIEKLEQEVPQRRGDWQWWHPRPEDVTACGGGIPQGVCLTVDGTAFGRELAAAEQASAEMPHWKRVTLERQKRAEAALDRAHEQRAAATGLGTGSPMLCNHANENPWHCPCDADCYCKGRTCEAVTSAPTPATAPEADAEPERNGSGSVGEESGKDEAWQLTNWILREWKGDGLACERICERIREYAAQELENALADIYAPPNGCMFDDGRVYQADVVRRDLRGRIDALRGK